MGFLTTILAILALGVLIALHELGHMMVAKWCGMRVLRYSVGFGPVLWRRTRGETTYQLAGVPFGGFVEIDGMNPEEEREHPDDPRLYENRALWQRALVIFAGPATNYLFAIVFGFVLFATLGVPSLPAQHDLEVGVVNKHTPAAEAGIQPKDVITHVDGYPVRSIGDFKTVVQARLMGYRHEPDAERRDGLRRLSVSARRGAAEVTVVEEVPKGGELAVTLSDEGKGKGARVTARRPGAAPDAYHGLQPGDVVVAVNGGAVKDAAALTQRANFAAEGFRWVGQDTTRVTLHVRRGKTAITRDVKIDPKTGLVGVVFDQAYTFTRVGVDRAASRTLELVGRFTTGTLAALRKLVGGDKKVASSASGPVGIVAEVQRRFRAGVPHALLMVFQLSVLLGLFNILPIPALDGGRLVFHGLEAVARRRLSPRIEARIHYYGFLVLLALMLLLTVKDVRACAWF